MSVRAMIISQLEEIRSGSPSGSETSNRNSIANPGATTAGPSGGEMLGLLALAVHARIPTPELETMIYAYPTFHRAIGDAVREMLSGT